MPERGDAVESSPDGQDLRTPSTGPIVNVEQAAAWDGPSGAAWVAREGFQNAALAAHTARLFDAADVGPSDHVLDVGCGTGDTTRRAARLARGGTAYGVDLSTAMLARAREQAAADGLVNATFERADAQVHRLGDARHDVVISRFGVMFFADPVAAFANIARSTRRGGRLAVVVWQALERNDWVAVPRSVLALGRDLPPIPDDVPGPFGLADADRLERILTDAGWSDVHLDDAQVPYDYGADPERAAHHASEIGILRGLVTDLDDDQRARAMEALTTTMAQHTGAGGVRLDSRAWVVRAVR